MKKRVLLIFSILLTVVWLIGAIPLVAHASEAPPTVCIDKFNLVFDDNVYLKYAVKFEGVEDADITASNIGMLYFTVPQDDYTAGGEAYTSQVVGYTTIGGQKYYTFEYRHITAKQMTDNIYSVAYIEIDGEKYYSEPVKYSVLDYAYIKLGKTGIASTNESFRNMLSSMLVYGADAQRYFNYNTERLADADYYQVSVVGGTLEDGFTHGLYHSGEMASLSAFETDDLLSCQLWEDSNGELITADDSFTLTNFEKNETYTRVFTSHTETIDLAVEPTCTETGLTKGAHCSACGTVLTAQEPIPVTPHQRWESREETLTVFTTDNSASYPFTVSENQITSTNQDPSSSSAYTIIAQRDFTLDLSYQVSSESNYDWLTIVHNTTEKAHVSGSGTWTALSISMQAGDTVTITYSKDGSVSSNDDCARVKILTDASTTVQSEGYVDLTETKLAQLVTCTENVTCDICGNIAMYALGHDRVFHEAQASTCMEKGWNAYETCTRCDYTTFTEIPVSHRYNAENTCTQCMHYKDPGLVFESVGTHSYIVVGYTGSESTLIIPSTYMGKPVTEIESDAFMGNNAPNRLNLISIIISNGITRIGDDAFNGCSNLETLVLPDSLISVEPWAFEGCTSLAYNTYDQAYYLGSPSNPYLVLVKAKETNITSCTIHPMTKSIYYRAFYDCSELTDLTIPDSVIEIGGYVFDNCSSLEYNVYDNAYYLGNESNPYLALVDVIEAWSITACEIHPNTKIIAGTAFASCSELTSIEIPNGVISIGFRAFDCCSKLEEVTIPNSVVSVQTEAFYSCGALKTVTIPGSIKTVSATMFGGCSALTTVIIQEGVERIGVCAFDRCSNMTTVILPESVVHMGSGAFDVDYSCKVYYYGTQTDWDNICFSSSNSWLTNDLESKLPYVYSEIQPATSGRFWHYVDGVPTEW